MPEILEVEAYRGLAQEALGRTITGARVVDGRYVGGRVTPRALASALKGRTVTGARRRGKLLLLDTDGPTLGLRFGMTGALILDGRAALGPLRYAPAVTAPQWIRFSLDFGDAGRLELHDPRRLGKVELDPDEDRLGPDALAVTRAQLARALDPRSSHPPALKARLMDQRRLAGVGNLLADEALWRAGLSPERRDALDPDELGALARTLRATLRQLGRRGGSHTGELMEERRDGGRCPRDGTALRRARVGGRTTYWCPSHQR
jgi:formamidopyrimidine-DNA glycosylase